jgi:beta-lactam-binding protein with PASTA domain
MSENKSYLDTLTDQTKPESYRQEQFVKVPDKSGRRKAIAIVIALVVLLFGIYALYRVMNTVTVPDFSGMTLEEANVWATQNRIILASRSSYNFDIAAGNVISQASKAGSKIQKNSTLTIDVSLGADPDEKISWPDIKSMTLDQLQTWVDENKLTGIKISTANSDVIEADHVISYTLTDDTQENFVRKSRATIVVSIGPAAQSDTVVVSDFAGMKTAEVVQWGKDNGVTITLDEAFDDYVSAGSVVSQSVKANTEILKTVAVTVVISKGKPISVPDFSILTQEDANSWAKANNIPLDIQQRYSGDIGQGSLISQGTAAGTSIAAGDEIKLMYSLGQIEVASYVGRTKIDMVNWLNDVNSKGGNISITFSKAYGDKGTADKIIRQSIKNDYINPGTRITVVISLGMRLLAPDFAGKTEAECRQMAQTAGLTILFTYKHSDTVAIGHAISQSPAASTVTTDANPVTVTIAY